MCRKAGQALHATTSQLRPHHHHQNQNRVAHDEEYVAHCEEDDGEGLDVVGLDVGSQQDQPRRLSTAGTDINVNMRVLSSAIYCMHVIAGSQRGYFLRLKGERSGKQRDVI